MAARLADELALMANWLEVSGVQVLPKGTLAGDLAAAIPPDG